MGEKCIVAKRTKELRLTFVENKITFLQFYIFEKLCWYAWKSNQHVCMFVLVNTMAKSQFKAISIHLKINFLKPFFCKQVFLETYCVYSLKGKIAKISHILPSVSGIWTSLTWDVGWSFCLSQFVLRHCWFPKKHCSLELSCYFYLSPYPRYTLYTLGSC